MSRRLVVVLLGAALLTACASASNPNRPPASGPGVYFIEPAQGATVTSPFKVKFGIQGMDVKPAGEQVAGSGHHHLLIGLESQAKGEIIPVDDQHVHRPRPKSSCHPAPTSSRCSSPTAFTCPTART